MKRKWQVYAMLALLAVLIVDNKTAQNAIADGLQLCLLTLIPALFPFLLLSSLLAAGISAINIPGGGFIEKMLRIPRGSANIFFLGLLGGYPIGAKCICQAHKEGRLSGENCRRMLGFCSNAGPSFLFGIGLTLFPEKKYCWYVWLIQILSAMITGIITPGGDRDAIAPARNNNLKPGTVLRQSIATMAMICGWVICFRVALVYLHKWILIWFQPLLQTCLGGILELANGCCELKHIDDIGNRFVIFAGLLAFGGLCVAMQTTDLAQEAKVDTGGYLPAKACQAGVAVILSALIFPGHIGIKPSWLLFTLVPVICYPIFLGTNQKNHAGIHQLIGV